MASEDKNGVSFLFRWRKSIYSRHGPESGTTRAVLMALSMYMNSDGDSCFPSTKTLEEASGFSEKTVIRHLHKAEEEGWIKIRRRDADAGQGWRRHTYRARIPLGPVRQWHPGGQDEARQGPP